MLYIIPSIEQGHNSIFYLFIKFSVYKLIFCIKNSFFECQSIKFLYHQRLDLYKYDKYENL